MGIDETEPATAHLNVDRAPAAKDVYDTSVTLTQDQKDIADFWADNAGGTGTHAVIGRPERVAEALIGKELRRAATFAACVSTNTNSTVQPVLRKDYMTMRRLLPICCIALMR